jgi:hypothetical protein
MTKKQLREWPWNNQPSKRHVWKFLRMSDLTGAVEQCTRCGRSFIEKADTRGPVYCNPTAQWLVEHPDDYGAQG